MRFFNTAGPVNMGDHYRLNPLERFDTEEILYFSLINVKQKFWAKQKFWRGLNNKERKCSYTGVSLYNSPIQYPINWLL